MESENLQNLDRRYCPRCGADRLRIRHDGTEYLESHKRYDCLLNQLMQEKQRDEFASTIREYHEVKSAKIDDELKLKRLRFAFKILEYTERDKELCEILNGTKIVLMWSDRRLQG